MGEPAEYDRIGDRYSEAKQQPFRIHVEAYTLEKLAGDVSGARILDLACGDGFYSRRLMRRGAAATVGVDASAEMIALARHAEDVAPLGCSYQHGDVAEVADDAARGTFDLVVASYLLNYARTRAELRRFCDAAARSLRAGGRLVGVNDHTDDATSGPRDFAKHRFHKIGPDPYSEGAPIIYEFLLPEARSFAITNYYWRPETYLAELRAAGFAQAEWLDLEISPEGRDSFASGFFDDLVARRPIAILSARR